MKIGFLGGSFDPVHFGHLIAAQDALENQALDRVVLVPSAQAPLKDQPALSSPADRLAMLRACVDGNPRYEISDFEMKKGGVSYTIDSARHFRSAFPSDRLFWIIGSDQLTKLPLWRDIEELAQLLEFICLERPGYPLQPAPSVPGLRVHRCAGHLFEISSSDLRARAACGLSLDYFIPHKAIVHIREKGLYRAP